jgi:hypothetical protein
MSGVFGIIVGPWSGMRRINSTFMWASNFNIGPQSLSFVKWVPGEPGNLIGGVTLMTSSNYRWNDVPTNELKNFVCKKVCVDLCCARKGVIRSCNPNKDRQYNCQDKNRQKDKQ